MSIKRFTQSQRFRVIVDSACFYATAKQIRLGVGDFISCNAAVQRALDALEITRSNDDYMSCATGLGIVHQGTQVQINMA